MAQASAAAVEVNNAVQAPQGEDLVGYGVTTAGEPVLMVTEAQAADSETISAIAEEHGVKKLVVSGAAVPDASTDVVGGAGYMGPTASQPGYYSACSIGFTAWSPDGDPALITAGHCEGDGDVSQVELSLPSEDPAVTGNPKGGYVPDGNGTMGAFGFAQYGGIGNTPGADEDPNSIDIAVIDVTEEKFDLKPEVTDWTTATADDLAASTTPIRGVSLPQSGDVTKSGRTTGITTGDTVVDMHVIYDDGTEGVEPIEMLDGYMPIGGRYVHGFLGSALTEGGDSGGAVFQGDQAVGVVSGGPKETPELGEDWAWYSLLEPSLEHTGGYTVAIHLDAPTVDGVQNGDTVALGSNIVVSVPAPADTLVVSRDGGASTEVAVEGGKATVQAPDAEGEYTYSFTSKKGYDTSEATQLTITAEDILEKPFIDGQTITADEGADSATTTITGTGEPGATVKINDIWEAQVGEDGEWEFPDTSFGIGENTLTAVQTLDGKTSPEATGTITVKPAAPSITSIKPNQSFPAEEAPSSISGKGLAGADISATVNDVEVTGQSAGGDQVAGAAAADLTVGEDGAWTIDFGAPLEAGTYSVRVAQTLNSVASEPTSIVFTVEAADVVGPGPGEEPPVEPGPGDPIDELPLTGGTSMLPFGLAALGMLVLGGGAVLLTARRTQAADRADG